MRCQDKIVFQKLWKLEINAQEVQFQKPQAKQTSEKYKIVNKIKLKALEKKQACNLLTHGAIIPQKRDLKYRCFRTI